MSDPAYRSWASEKDMEQAFADYGEAITNQVSITQVMIVLIISESSFWGAAPKH